MRRRSVRLAFAAAVLLPGLDVAVTDGLGMSCARRDGQNAPLIVPPAPAKAEQATAPAPEPKAEPLPPPKTPRELLREWLAARVPEAAELQDDGPGVSVAHVARKGDTLKAIAAAYVDVTTVYSEGELVAALLKANPSAHLGYLAPGTKIAIPHVVGEVPKPPSESRLGWPQDRALAGIYVNATMAGHPSFPSTLDKMAVRGLNAIVVDAKDVTGYFTYRSKIPLAVSIGANKHATVSSFERLVRHAHSRGVRVVARVACFRDEHLGPKRHDLAVQRKGGGAHVAPSKIVDWLDPAIEDVQKYLLDVVDEVLAAGVDEVQLDYVRYPTEGVYDADFKLKERKLTTVSVITDFVAKVHEHTKAASVPLSLDVFGVVAWRFKADMDATGQDLRALAPHIEALSPMVYPSHFAEGFNGYEKPGDHPDVVAIGTKRALDEIKAVGADVVVRPWVQAFPWKTSNFGSQYVADQIAQAKIGGGIGWLAWNSGGEYGATFAAVQPKKGTVVAAK